MTPRRAAFDRFGIRSGIYGTPNLLVCALAGSGGNLTADREPTRVGPGERLYVRVEPQGKPGAPAPQLRGGLTVAGGCYLYVLPFDIYVTPDLAQPSTVELESTAVTIYPPFLNDMSERAIISQIRPDRIPFSSRGVGPDYDRLILEALSLPWPIGQRRDALRIDVSPGREAEFAESLVTRFLSLCRWWTRQWWITRDRGHSESSLRNWFEINAFGERVSAFHSFARTYGLFGMERPLNREGFEEIVRDLAIPRDIPAHLDTFFDAVHSHSVAELRRAVLELATASEVALDRALSLKVDRGLLNRRQMKRILDGHDFLQHLQRAGRFFGKNFATESPSHYPAVRTVWVARGQIAHGHAPFVIDSGQKVALESKHVVAGIIAVSYLIGWIDSL